MDSFEELRKEIYFKLVYPDDILVTKKDALNILQISDYYLNKLRKTLVVQGFYIKGFLFFYKDDVLDYFMKQKQGVKQKSVVVKSVNLEEIKKKVSYKLFYPYNLETRKSAPTFLGLFPTDFKSIINRLKRFEYDHQGMKFYYKEDLQKWAIENEKFLKRLKDDHDGW